MSDAIVVSAEFHVRPYAVDTWLRLMLDHYGQPAWPSPGMLRYWLHHEDEDPHILLCEQWADRADFDASLRAAWRADYQADMSISGPPHAS